MLCKRVRQQTSAFVPWLPHELLCLGISFNGRTILLTHADRRPNQDKENEDALITCSIIEPFPDNKLRTSRQPDFFAVSDRVCERPKELTNIFSQLRSENQRCKILVDPSLGLRSCQIVCPQCGMFGLLKEIEQVNKVSEKAPIRGLVSIEWFSLNRHNLLTN